MTNEKNGRPGKNGWDDWGKPLTLSPASHELGDAKRTVWDEVRVNEHYALQEDRPRGRPPNWLKKTKLMVSLGQIKDLEYLREPYMGGVLDHLLSPEMDALFETLRAEKRQGQLVDRAAELNSSGAADKGRETQGKNGFNKNASVLEKFQKAHPEIPSNVRPIARVVAKWDVTQSNPVLPTKEKATKIASLTRTLQRGKQAT